MTSETKRQRLWIETANDQDHGFIGQRLLDRSERFVLVVELVIDPLVRERCLRDDWPRLARSTLLSGARSILATA